MPTLTATATAHPNIAFIKYWGNRDASQRLPQNSSLSFNLDGLLTRTRVSFSPALTSDSLKLNGKTITGPGLARVVNFLQLVRNLAGETIFAAVESTNNFPTGAGIASSAAAFAALALAATSAIGMHLNEKDLSRLARRGSGSACRSVPGGFVEWQAGVEDADSYAASIAPPTYWDLIDCIAVVNASHKPTGSTEGHELADTSPLQTARVVDTPRRLALCRSAVLSKDFSQLAEIVEQDSNLMHAVMLTSQPPLLYWQPATLAVMQAVQGARKRGLPACYTIDAGANVHVLTLASDVNPVRAIVEAVPGVSQIIQAGVGGPAMLQKPSLDG
ncbi:MAG TPA: diphosphomevalonate decarboxylase [Anaerolineaceae bacterium]